ncbi:MAG: sensor histidine kinase [Polyangiales bacterium]
MGSVIIEGVLRGLLLVIALVVSADARAEHAPVDVAAKLDGQTLASQLTWLEDPAGTLSLDDVIRRDSSFRDHGVGSPMVAFSDSTYWARLPVRNGAGEARRWFLEVAYPHLDTLTLYAPRPDGGYDAHHTGDTLPFRQRDVWFYNFVFAREEPARSVGTYYLRVHSRGKVSLPLRAWEPIAFHQHQLAEWGVFCALYGALLVMVAYVLCIYFVLGGAQHLYYAGYLFASFAGSFTLSGHTFQLLLPDSPELVHRLLPLTVEAGYTAVLWMVGAQLRAIGVEPPKVLRVGSLAPLVVIPALPYELAVRALAVHAVILTPLALYALWLFSKRGAREARRFVISFSLPLLGVLLTSVAFTVESSRETLMRWAFLTGVLAQAALISSQLADQLNANRARLAISNALHTERIGALSSALRRATRAGKEAERATRMRDQFMATLSHEFRTPLNAIINIPAVLREQFRELPTVVCGRCEAEFELEPGEVVDASTRCPDCAAEGVLRVEGRLSFTGDARKARALVRRVLQSGRRLLRVVNDILAFSRMQAKSVELVRERVSIAEIIRASVAEAVRVTPLQREMVHVEASESIEVLGDEEKLAEVFAQLLDNALKFARGPCKVTIRAIRRGTHCLVSVEDEGIGIEAGDRERIFTEFEQLSSGDTRRYGGTGLGLTLCRALVEAHGGKIWVESTPNVGSTFFLTLPRPRDERRPVLVPT